jgi:PKD repeat protein
MPSDHVYGHWDMHETLPSQYWRYNFQDGVQYPSSAGLSAKYITTVKVYSSPESDWTLELDGRDIGGVNYTVSKPFLEEAIACQFGADHKATYTDIKGRVWEGMPLWFFAGFVDDADQHSANAYNVTKALAGYNIVITGNDSYTTTISSKDIIRSSNYLLANSLNGTHIADSDENWPLRLTGANVTGSMTVKGVKSIKLIRIAEPPVANFTASPTSGTAPLTVKFTDISTGATSWSWVFGDGATSTDQNPQHIYSNPGSFTVTLTVSNAGGTSSKNTQIVVATPPPVANFTVTPTTGTVPLTVKFTDSSIGATSRSWVFGDGATSTDQNPTHIYTVAGTYTAKLTVTNAGGSANKQVTITVQPPTVKKPVAKFTQDKYSGKVPLTVKFTDKSQNNPTSYLWNFGDGSTSTDKNPSHTYKKIGGYIVRLKATNSAGSDSTTSVVAVLPKWWPW